MPQQLHDIALRCIFDMLLPSQGLLNPELSEGSDSPWNHLLRAKKAFALVCKQWYNVAFPSLYDDIVLRRVGQLPALVETIRSDPLRFSELPRSLTLTFVVPATCWGVSNTCITYLLNECPRIKTLNFFAPFGYDWESASLIPTSRHRFTDAARDIIIAIQNASDRLESLTFQEGEDGDTSPNVIPFLAHFTNLRSLTLTVPILSEGSESLTFNKLTELSLSHPHRTASCFCFGYVAQWNLPSLTYFTLRGWISKFDWDDSSHRYISFFERHGRRIQYLDFTSFESYAACFRYGDRSPYLSGHIKNMVAHCPSLRHVVLGEHLTCRPLMDALLTDDRRSVFVDVWTKPYPRPDLHIDRHEPDGYSELFRPRTRLLDGDLCHFSELPRLLPPWEHISSPIVHRIFDMRLIQASWFICRDAKVELGDWDGVLGTVPSSWVKLCASLNDDEASDSDYIPSEGTSSSSSSYSSDEEEIESVPTEPVDFLAYLAPHQTESQLSETEVLTRFRAMDPNGYFHE